MCDISCQVGWLCSTPKITTASVRTSLISTERSSGEWEQCGGEGYDGPTTCVSNLTCYVQNSAYSLCLKNCPKYWQCKENGKILYNVARIIFPC